MKGWFNHPCEHALASKGISTNLYAKGNENNDSLSSEDARDYLKKKTGLSWNKIKDMTKGYIKGWKRQLDLPYDDFSRVTRMNLVGSYRKGKSDEFSDIDVLVGYEGSMKWDEVIKINMRDNRIYSPKLERTLKIDIIPVKDDNFESELRYYLEGDG